jgi:integrase
LTKRRGHGEGSVHQRADGRWAGVADLGFAGGQRRRKYVYAETQAGAIKALREVRKQLDRGMPAPDDRITVGQLLDRWYADVLRHQVAPVAFENYRTIADKHVRPTLERKRLSSLAPADVDALLSAKLDEGCPSRPCVESAQYSRRPSPKPSAGDSSPATSRRPPVDRERTEARAGR